MKKILTIAGSDSSGGAGIQADLKTFLANGTYGMSAITAITAQNTTGVFAIQDIDPAIVKAELDAVFTDIIPDAVKIGMVSSPELIHVIAEALKQYDAKNIVLDTVMVSTSGYSLLKPEAKQALITELLPLAAIITPNIPESEVLAQREVKTKEDMEEAAKIIAAKTNAAILIKGGHLEDTADDLLYIEGTMHWLRGRRIQTENTHGTGCTLSSAIAANLGKELSLLDAVKAAKEYLAGALEAGLDLGKGNGPVDHGWDLKKTK
ncbi:MAG: bifunctional hydroxymethylpyrimidine kinase/phosphomethylpyrimidine kinase [Clostridiales bacterium]|nr:bifunctional hydroxymethylpyrimidine kinase/phosphomethylpyrimidine kinase [Clostridiales bacterium]